MNFHDEIPILIFHLLEGDISEDSCIIDEDIDSSEIIHCCFNNLISKLDRIIVGYSRASFRFNFLNNFICSWARSTFAGNTSSKIIHNNFSSSTGKE